MGFCVRFRVHTVLGGQRSSHGIEAVVNVREQVVPRLEVLKHSKRLGVAPLHVLAQEVDEEAFGRCQPVPVPLEPSVSQDALLVEVQAHEAPVVSVTVTVSPAVGDVRVAGVSA